MRIPLSAPALRLPAGAPRGPGLGALLPVLGTALVGGVASLALVGTFGGQALLVVGGLAGLALATIAFYRVPHAMLAFTVVLFALQPALKLFGGAAFGPAKDLIAIAACLAAMISVRARQNLDGDTRNDAWLVSGALLMIALYIASPVRPHDTAWFHGSRLAVEAFGLLLAGYALPNPTRSFEWTMKALIGVCCLEALVGLAQQAIGTTRLVLRLHYTYGEQVRETSTGQLRSFGTLDEPFNYATLLLLGLVALMVTARGRILVPSLISVLLIVGLAASVVRTAALALAVIAAIWLLRKARLEAAIALLLAMVVASCALIALAPGATGNSGGAANFILTLNGRTTVWGQLINSPTAWIAGRGVGAVGTGANRAQSGSVYQPTRGGSPVAARTQTDVDKFNVDSSYLSFVADVGLVGLALLLALFARILKLGVTAARRGSDAGWAAVTITIVMLIDATTRTSLTSFPVGFIALVLIGLSLAACQHDRRPVAARL